MHVFLILLIIFLICLSILCAVDATCTQLHRTQAQAKAQIIAD